MEQMADKGNGSIAYIDTLLEAKKVFVTQLTGTLLTIAKDVKIQVEFNPGKVKAYRLVGYENRKLENKDFNDDKKDAGEIGAGHSVTALYEIVPADLKEEFGKTDALKYQQVAVKSSDELMTVKLRYKEPSEDTSKLLTKVVKATEELAAPSGNFNFAASVAEFGMLLRNSPYKANASYQAVIDRAKAAKGQDPNGDRADFIRLAETAQMIDTRTK
jgi:Ca-activated chloride channel family protein